MNKQQLFKAALRITALLILTLLMFNLIPAQPVHAATFVVTKTADTFDGVCNADCSLREAITAANAAGGSDIITFDPALDGSLITLSLVGLEDNNAVGDLDIRDSLTLQGNGVNTTVIDATSAVTQDRAFHIPVGGITVTFSDLTIQNGRTQRTGFPLGCGGALAVVTGSGNQVTINNSRLTNHYAFDRGGAVCVEGVHAITVNNSTFDNNQSDSTNGFEGGAIRSNGGILTINSSTFTQNSARVYGGAIFANGGALNVNNSTFSRNVVDQQGGAIAHNNTASINNSTFYANYSYQNAGNAIFRLGGTTNLRNSILTGHTLNTTCQNFGGTSTNNLVSDISCGLAANPVTNFDIALQDNGGPTATHNLFPGSNAINAGVANCPDQTNTPLATDQRGVARPDGVACDIGAVEWTAALAPVHNPDSANSGTATSPPAVGGPESPLITLTVDTPNDVLDANGGNCAGIVQANLPGPDGLISLREAICATNNTAGTDTILFDASLDGRPILLSRIGVDDNNTVGDIDIRGSLILQGNGAQATIIDAGSALTRDRAFDIPVPNLTVTFNDLTIQNGRTLRASFPGGCGGALLMNQANTQVTINNSHLTNNFAFDRGGVICNDNSGTLVINDTTVANNRTHMANGYEGGVIRAGILIITINNSTFANNSSRIHGGAIFTFGVLNINNSTFSRNLIVDGLGGGIFGLANTNINNVTFYNNRSLVNNGNALYRNAGTWTLRNTILAGHTNPTCTNFAGTSINNRINDATCGVAAVPVTNFDPALADNGGRTATHALLHGSNAVNFGAFGCPSHLGPPLAQDQRGVTRPQGAACDIGAFELGRIICGIQAAGEPATYVFGSMEIEVTNDGSDLDCIRSTYIPSNHPNGTSAIQSGEYWDLEGLRSDQSTPATVDFTFDILLPHTVSPDTNTSVCRYTGGLGWNCARTGSNATQVWRDGFTGGFSDWAVGNQAGPTAITTQNVASQTSQPTYLALILLLLVLLAITIKIVWRRIV